MKPRPYVGITGFTKKEDIDNVSLEYHTQGFFNSDNTHIPMYGFLVSAKRMSDVTKRGKQSPAAQDLPYLCGLSPRGVLTALHYFTKDQANLASEVETVFSMGGLYQDNLCRALQINTFEWPHLDEVKKIKDMYSEMNIILQLPKQVTQGQPVEEVGAKVSSYADLASYILIDPSGGLGKEFDNTYTQNLIRVLESASPHSTIGVAGGLCGDNVTSKIGSLISGSSSLISFDAQGRLRNSTDKTQMDYEKVSHYISESARVLG